jgi:hypothetical protein
MAAWARFIRPKISGLYEHDKSTGEKIDCSEKNGKLGLYGEQYASSEGTNVSLVSGTNDSKIAVLDGPFTKVFWTLGNPSDWEGAWDEFQFENEISPFTKK